MKFSVVRVKVFIACLCTVITSAFALTGCSERANEQYEIPAGNSSLKIIGEYPTESSEMPADDTSSEINNEFQTSDDEGYQPYDEIYVDQQFLETLAQDRLYVKVNLHIDDKTLRSEYEEKYPNLVENNYYWGRFLSNCGDQIIREFVCDYDIDYEGLESVFKMGGNFACELNKGTISSMLNDTRVAEITYAVGDPPIIVDF